MRSPIRPGCAPTVAWRGGRWLSALAGVVVVGVVDACSSASLPRPDSGVASYTQLASPASSSSSSARAAADAAAIAEVSAYLALWAEAGPYAAASAYLVPDEQAPSGANTTWPEPDAGPQTPVLVAGSAVSYVPWQWTSPDHFTLYVEMNLTFRGDTSRANWAQGRNWRFFTFTRPDASTGYRMYIGTGP